jgi:cytochrome P450
MVMGALWSAYTLVSVNYLTNIQHRGILHNPEDYPNPHIFNPARYLTPDGILDQSVRDPRTACFGFGRRICPGRYLADASLFAMVSTLLATVDIVRAKDSQGQDIIPKVEVAGRLTCHLKPFPWSVRPRSQDAKAMLETSLAGN